MGLHKGKGAEDCGGDGSYPHLKLCGSGRLTQWLPAEADTPCPSAAAAGHTCSPDNHRQSSSAVANGGSDGGGRQVPEQGSIPHGDIKTRWYNAPEVLLSGLDGTPADIWSYGCTLAELATGGPLFRGHSSLDQLCRIIRCLGPLPPGMAGRGREEMRLAQDVAGEGKTLEHRMEGVDLQLLEVVSACLALEPRRRPSARDLASFPYFDDVLPEPDASNPPQLPPTPPPGPSPPSGTGSGPGPSSLHGSSCDGYRSMHEGSSGSNGGDSRRMRNGDSGPRRQAAPPGGSSWPFVEALDSVPTAVGSNAGPSELKLAPRHALSDAPSGRIPPVIVPVALMGQSQLGFPHGSGSAVANEVRSAAGEGAAAPAETAAAARGGLRRFSSYIPQTRAPPLAASRLARRSTGPLSPETWNATGGYLDVSPLAASPEHEVSDAPPWQQQPQPAPRTQPPLQVFRPLGIHQIRQDSLTRVRRSTTPAHGVTSAVEGVSGDGDLDDAALLVSAPDAFVRKSHFKSSSSFVSYKNEPVVTAVEASAGASVTRNRQDTLQAPPCTDQLQRRLAGDLTPPLPSPPDSLSVEAGWEEPSLSPQPQPPGFCAPGYGMELHSITTSHSSTAVVSRAKWPSVGKKLSSGDSHGYMCDTPNARAGFNPLRASVPRNGRLLRAAMAPVEGLSPRPANTGADTVHGGLCAGGNCGSAPAPMFPTRGIAAASKRDSLDLRSTRAAFRTSQQRHPSSSLTPSPDIGKGGNQSSLSRSSATAATTPTAVATSAATGSLTTTSILAPNADCRIYSAKGFQSMGDSSGSGGSGGPSGSSGKIIPLAVASASTLRTGGSAGWSCSTGPLDDAGADVSARVYGSGGSLESIKEQDGHPVSKTGGALPPIRNGCGTEGGGGGSNSRNCDYNCGDNCKLGGGGGDCGASGSAGRGRAPLGRIAGAFCTLKQRIKDLRAAL